jgi:hypothetical protein
VLGRSAEKLDPILGYRVQNNGMPIGELSTRVGINVQTIRSYEREKLLRRPGRTASGYRTFKEAELERVRFIKDSQQLGFTLQEEQGSPGDSRKGEIDCGEPQTKSERVGRGPSNRA